MRVAGIGIMRRADAMRDHTVDAARKSNLAVAETGFARSAKHSLRSLRVIGARSVPSVNL